MKAWTERSAGVLLHATSLPSGRLDDHAQRFADFAQAAGFRVWQMLPVGPLDRYGSPYQPDSAFAGDTALFSPATVTDAQIAQYRDDNADWLHDYALFAALEARFAGMPWHDWPAPLRDREPAALAAARRELAPAIAVVVRGQCAFDRAWSAFRRSVNDRGLLLFGDVPLFLAHHSADVWAHRELFEVGADGRCEAFMGVPPDAFAEEGQWWGYPPYRWDAMAAESFRWWRRRFEVQARRFDLVRIDHFRGLAAFWRIPRGARTARDGAWIPGPGRACLDALQPALKGARLVAEDLGYITDDVVALRHDLGLPGMRVLQFGFDGDPDNPHLPHRHAPDSVCYTGTHDNDTTLGWWQALDEGARALVRRYLRQGDPRMPQSLIESAWASPAPLSVVPMQDLLGLPTEARMNRPGVTLGNWAWRFEWSGVPEGLASRVRTDLARHGRLAKGSK